jgi:hypothetical protein
MDGALTVTDNEEATVTVATAVLLQLPSLPVTVYVVVVVKAGVVGFAVEAKPPVQV